MEPLIHLRDKVAIVTGASRGIGESIARTYAQHGAKVVVASRKIDGLRSVAEAIEKDGGEALAHACHTGSKEQIEELFAAAIARFGKVDVVVNNAATNPYFGPMVSIEEAAFDKTFEVNVKGYFYTSCALVQHLSSRNAGGAIVNVASVAALLAMPLQGVYAMTKAAVVSMTKTLAMELGPSGIRVNAIAPGLVDTKFASALTANPDILKMVMDRTALKKVAQPIDIAGVALLLASDAGAYMTGETVVVDGGWTL